MPQIQFVLVVTFGKTKAMITSKFRTSIQSTNLIQISCFFQVCVCVRVRVWFYRVYSFMYPPPR